MFKKKALFIEDHTQFGGTERVLSNLKVILDSINHTVSIIFSFSASDKNPFYGIGCSAKIVKLNKNCENNIPYINSICSKNGIDTVIFIGYHLLFFNKSIASLISFEPKLVLITQFSTQNFLKINFTRPFFKNIITNSFKYLQFIFLWKRYYKSKLNDILTIGNILCVSEKCKYELREMFFHQKHLMEKIDCIYNPIFLDSPEVDFSKKEKKIIYVSRLRRKKKNSMLILKAWKLVYKHYTDWELQIIGDGEIKNELEEYIFKYRLKNVDLLGIIKNVDEYFIKSQITLMSSDSDALPQALVEGANYGNAIVSTAFDGGVKEIVYEGVNGFIVPKNDHIMFAKKIINLLEDDSLRKRMCEQSPHLVEKFRAKNVAIKWQSYLNAI